MAAELEDVQPEKGAASKKTLQIITVLVPAIAGILGTFITVLPQLRSKDVAIGNLEQQVSELKSKHLNITGKVMDSSGKPLSWAEVYFVPQNKPKLIGHTDGDGSFSFPDMPDQRYRIVVRDSLSGNIGVGELDEDRPETRLQGAVEALVRYHVEK